MANMQLFDDLVVTEYLLLMEFRCSSRDHSPVQCPQQWQTPVDGSDRAQHSNALNVDSVRADWIIWSGIVCLVCFINVKYNVHDSLSDPELSRRWRTKAVPMRVLH